MYKEIGEQGIVIPKCQNCQKSFNTQKAYNSHMKGCGTHVCDVCGKEFQGKKNLESILKTLNVNIVPNVLSPIQG